jgi:glycosyltransferase involved in cell wall biosynthesis
MVPLGPEVFPGLPMTPGIKQMLDELPPEETFDPYEVDRALHFVRWMEQVPSDSTSGLPRYFQAVYNERDDLRKAFPEVERGELRWFAWWAHLWGRYECPTLRLFGHIPPVVDRGPSGERLNGGADVIGFFHAEHGIGEASRLLVQALRSAGVGLSTLSYRNTESRQRVSFDTDEYGRYKVVIAAVNAELNQPLRDQFGEYLFRNTYVIGQWFWELETPPPWYKPAYRLVDELWAPTRFIEEMLVKSSPKRVKVRYMPLPLREPRVVEGVTKVDLGIPERYMFLFTFDFMSVMKRKNPVGLVEAFRRAFPDGDGPVLVLKSINGNSRPEASRVLREAIGDAMNIVWIDRYLDSEQSAALMNLCDCYVSLHRSEGLGLTMAEAMLLGKPVIATGYSGNLDFMKPDTSYLVPWKKVPVGSDAEAYDPHARWAEPDLDEAARLMRHVYENPEEAQSRAKRGQQDLRMRFTPEAAGERMKSRLEEIWRVLT